MSDSTTPGPQPLASPPAVLPQLSPLLWTDDLWRISNGSELDRRSYPTPQYRFDAPNGEYPSLYACASDTGTFAEVYVERGRRLEPNEGKRYLLRLVPRVPLPLVDLHDVDVLGALNLDERISVGDDYPTCQQWALAFYQRYSNVCGIRYRARKAGALITNVMLYADRRIDALDVVAATRLDESEEIVLRAADRYRLTVYFPFRHSV